VGPDVVRIRWGIRQGPGLAGLKLLGCPVSGRAWVCGPGPKRGPQLHCTARVFISCHLHTCRHTCCSGLQEGINPCPALLIMPQRYTVDQTVGAVGCLALLPLVAGRWQQYGLGDLLGFFLVFLVCLSFILLPVRCSWYHKHRTMYILLLKVVVQLSPAAHRSVRLNQPASGNLLRDVFLALMGEGYTWACTVWHAVPEHRSQLDSSSYSGI
jgi:hypothetical protein